MSGIIVMHSSPLICPPSHLGILTLYNALNLLFVRLVDGRQLHEAPQQVSLLVILEEQRVN